VSTVCSDPFDYESTYRATLIALSLGQPGPEGRLVRVPDLGVYALLLNARRPDELAAFASATVSGLRRYDAENNTDLVQTLKIYLEERGKLPATAARMFVHPNTVSYRLNRIRDITGGHPSEMDVALRFELAFMIERLVGGSAPAGPVSCVRTEQ
jgi:DNA-binding PucR family transcriptional regulator